MCSSRALLSHFLLLLAFGFMPTACRGADGELESLEEKAFREAVALVEPAVVRIETVGGLDQVGELLLGTGPTTGLVVGEDGYIISSSFNFISKPASILVTFPDGRRFPAKQIANDKQRMLTLLKIEAQGLKPALAAPRNSIQVGQWSLAVGRTFDNEIPSVSVGIVSAVNRIWGKAIQTDAKISPVNYGGPLIDLRGQVLGVLVPLSPQGGSTTAGVEWYDSGIGFAVPLADIYEVLDRLKSGKDLLPGLLGVTFKGNDFSGSTDVLIDRVRYKSPAQIAGIKAGDRITAVDGETVKRIADIKHILGRKYAEDTLKVTILRDKEPQSLSVTLVDQLTPWEGAFLGILPARSATGPNGVAVRYLYEKSPAALAGLQAKDLIVAVRDSPITSAKTLAEAISRYAPGDKTTVTFRRGDKESTVEVTLASVPDTVPAELAAELIKAPEAKPGKLKTGRFTTELASHDHSYWAYVPEDYNPEHAYGLLVWLHPGGDTMEAAISQAWKTHCARRGIIILAPKAEKVAGWSAGEAEFVKDAVADIREKYKIDPSRIVAHTFQQGSGFTCHVVFKHPELFRGVAIANGPVAGTLPDHEPDANLQFYFLCGEQDPQIKRIKTTLAALRKAKFSAILKTLSGNATKYPSADGLEELARWIDSLDRL